MVVNFDLLHAVGIVVRCNYKVMFSNSELGDRFFENQSSEF